MSEAERGGGGNEGAEGGNERGEMERRREGEPDGAPKVYILIRLSDFKGL